MLHRLLSLALIGAIYIDENEYKQEEQYWSNRLRKLSSINSWYISLHLPLLATFLSARFSSVASTDVSHVSQLLCSVGGGWLCCVCWAPDRQTKPSVSCLPRAVYVPTVLCQLTLHVYC